MTTSFSKRRAAASVLAAAALLAGPGGPIPLPSAAAARATAANDPFTDPVALHKHFVKIWNDQLWDEDLKFYSVDALYLPPNHEPIVGNDAVVEFMKMLRPLLGPVAEGLEPLKVARGQEIASVAGNYAFTTSGVRLTSNETYQRQPDGTWKDTIEAFGIRGPLP
jgi:ketosteroid isomerase-like protein